MARRVLIFVALLAFAGTVCGQSHPAGFAIAGKTVNSVTGEVLPGVEVFLYRTNPSNLEEIDPAPQRLLTGSDGRFDFHVADAGKYLLAGEKAGFRRQSYEQHGFYFSAAVAGPGKDSENLVFRLSPDARVTGTVVDEDQEPVGGASVYLFRTDATGGVRKTYLFNQTSTDDRGHYRFPHLGWGWYSIAVMGEPWWSSMARNQQYSSKQYKEDAAFNLVYSTEFYPGVTDPASATQIALNEGQDFTADFTLSATTARILRLPHLNQKSQSRSAKLGQKLFGADVDVPTQRMMVIEDSVEISGVPAGSYTVDVSSYLPRSMTRAIKVDLAGDTDLNVDDLPSMLPITGNILLGEHGTLPSQPVVRLWNSKTGEMLESSLNPTGGFTFDGLSATPGSYSVFVGNIENSLIEKITATGARVVGQTVEITGAKPVHLSITLSHSLSRINGTAMRDGKPVAGVMVLLVPENPEVNLPLFRRDQSDSDGTFSMRDIVPGRYRMITLDNAWDAEWANLDVLKARLAKIQSAEVQPGRIYNNVINVE